MNWAFEKHEDKWHFTLRHDNGSYNVRLGVAPKLKYAQHGYMITSPGIELVVNAVKQKVMIATPDFTAAVHLSKPSFNALEEFLVDLLTENRFANEDDDDGVLLSREASFQYKKWLRKTQRFNTATVGKHHGLPSNVSRHIANMVTTRRNKK